MRNWPESELGEGEQNGDAGHPDAGAGGLQQLTVRRP